MAARKARSPQLSCTTWCFCWKEGNYSFQVQPGRHRQERWLKESIVVVVVAKSCPTFCNPMACNTPGFPDLHHLPELAQTHVYWSQWCHPTISSSIAPFSSCPQSFPASGSFLMSQFFEPGCESIVASTSASGLPMHIQGWFPLGLTGWSPCSPRDSRESSPTPQFKSINSSVLSFLHSPILTSIHHHWKNHRLD